MRQNPQTSDIPFGSHAKGQHLLKENSYWLSPADDFMMMPDIADGKDYGNGGMGFVRKIIHETKKLPHISK